MTPHLTQRGKWLVLAAGLFLVAGGIGGVAALLLVCDVALVLVASAYLAGVFRAQLLDGDGFDVTAEVEAGGRRRGLHRGDHFTIRMSVINRTALGLARVVVRPRLGRGIRMAEHFVVDMIRAREALDVTVYAEARRTGDWRWHGAHVGVEDYLGLVRVTTYIPIELRLETLPSRSAANALEPDLRRRRAQVQAGAHVLRQPGFGTELRELREYAPGDSFKHIAWKATARRGQLMVRQFEDEVVVSTMALLDISSSMRGGDEGAKFEWSLDLIFDLVHRVAMQQDRIGLVSFDDRVFGKLAVGAGAQAYRNIVRHLVHLQAPVGDDWTDMDEFELNELVADYLMVHHRLDFRASTKQSKRKAVGGLDPELLERWIESRFGNELGKRDRELVAFGHDIRGSSTTRRFASYAGLEVPYRTENRFGSKERGMAEAIRDASFLSRTSMLFVVVSDLCGMLDLGPVIEALALARDRRHRVLFVVPFTPDFVDVDEDDSAAVALHAAFSHAEREQRKGLIARLRSVGVEVMTAGKETSFDRVAESVSARRRIV